MHKGMKLLPVDLDRQRYRHLRACAELPGGSRAGSLGAGSPLLQRRAGASAYDPAVLLKIILLAYSRGLIGSPADRSGLSRTLCSWRCPATPNPTSRLWPPSFAELGDGAARLFAQVLTLCDRQGLIGRRCSPSTA